MKNKLITSLFLLILMLSLLGCVEPEPVAAPTEPSAQPEAPAEPQPEKVKPEDEKMLEFPVELISGETLTLNDLSGKTVMLVFFSVHCGHCHNESSHLEAIYQDYAKQDFIILSAEVSGADEATLEEFAEMYGITFPLGADTDANFARYLGVTGVPHNLLIDPNGNVVTTIRGFLDEATLRAAIDEVLAQQ